MNDNSFSLGSEYAELDSKLGEVAIQHPIFEQVNGPFPAIVFGDEGMGKTATALILTAKYQKFALSDNEESRVFPVYAPFETGIDAKEWVMEKLSRALVDFIADNPRRFLNAPGAQKTAMGRLMLRHAQSVDSLRLNFYSSPFDDSTGDINQVLEYLSGLRYAREDKLTKDETLNLLNFARPDAFDQVDFLWDIRSATPHEEVISRIKEIENLVLPLARQNLFIKIFAPLTVKDPLSGITGFHTVNNLVWNESQLRELIETRIKMFDTLWDRGIDDPTGLVVSATEHSPRLAIRFLIALLDYVDQHLQEDRKLNKTVFDKVALTLQR